jgi:hypothetical protein
MSLRLNGTLVPHHATFELLIMSRGAAAVINLQCAFRLILERGVGIEAGVSLSKTFPTAILHQLAWLKAQELIA